MDVVLWTLLSWPNAELKSEVRFAASSAAFQTSLPSPSGLSFYLLRTVYSQETTI